MIIKDHKKIDNDRNERNISRDILLRIRYQLLVYHNTKIVEHKKILNIFRKYMGYYINTLSFEK
jgi:hypothetical protein